MWQADELCKRLNTDNFFVCSEADRKNITDEKILRRIQILERRIKLPRLSYKKGTKGKRSTKKKKSGKKILGKKKFGKKILGKKKFGEKRLGKKKTKKKKLGKKKSKGKSKRKHN